MKEKLSPYLPGIALFIIALIIGIATYQDYGIAWDEQYQRGPGLLNYNYMFHGNMELFKEENDNHGMGFELFLLVFEKGLHLTDTREIYLNRHIVTNIFYLLCAFSGYVLVLKLFKNNKILASIGFIMLAFTPRLYGHSFFNSKDVPFMCMILVTLVVCRAAFEKDKGWLFFLMGMACGYATSIRIMGVMLGMFLLLFLLIDMFSAIAEKKSPVKPGLHILLYIVAFCLSLYISWPYIWRSPVHSFIESFRAMSHFKWGATTLVAGNAETATKLPWTYFPIWFTVTTPVVWLLAGIGGIGYAIYDISRKPLHYIKNTPERNYLLYLLCFFIPISSVIILHSVIYDDWRHMYFVWPPFVLLALYFINKFIWGKYKMVVIAVCAIQVLMVAFFMVKNHPFHQVYFNELVSHEDEYLRKNYEMDYWGCSFKQALDHILEADPRKKIRVCTNLSAYFEANILGMKPEDKQRLEFTPPEQADYFITNFRGHPEDYQGATVDYSISLLNSTMIEVIRMRNIDFRAQ